MVARLLGVRPDRPSAFSGTFSESIRTFSSDAARLKRWLGVDTCRHVEGCGVSVANGRDALSRGGDMAMRSWEFGRVPVGLFSVQQHPERRREPLEKALGQRGSRLAASS
jgi:hypothetical protein